MATTITPWQRRTFGILQLGGGVLGTALCAYYIAQQSSWISMLLFGLGAAAYIWGMACGVELLRASPHGLADSRLFWAVQIPVLQTSIAGYSFSCGLTVVTFVRWEPDVFAGMFTYFGSQFGFSLFQAAPQSFVGVNVFALATCIFFTRKLRAEAAIVPVAGATDQSTLDQVQPAADDKPL